ncbi:MAG TPA: hypothetical protein VI485_11185 [Vicinamibacterales bacterium]|nr:hypothetical protein [Vicinamibacterales bacterium]
MTESAARAVAAAAQLRAALEQTAASLATPRLDALLAGEVAIERALAALPALDDLSEDERRALHGDLEHAQRALLRCRRLGTSLRDFIRISFESQGRGPGYGPRNSADMSYAGQALDARV